MKNLKKLSIVTVLLVLFLIMGAFAFSSRQTYADTFQAQSFQKVIAAPNVLDKDAAGVMLWHDYGSFALYKVASQNLESLPLTTQNQLAVVDDTIWIDAYPFNPQTDSLANVPTAFRLEEVTGGSLQIVQFVGPIKDEWLDAVAATGATPIQYISNNAYLLWADDASRSQLSGLANEKAFVQFTAVYQPYFKLGNSFSPDQLLNADSNRLVKVVVQMVQHSNQYATEKFVLDTAVSVETAWEPILNFQNATITINSNDIPKLAAQPDVYWIGEWFDRELFDEVQGQIIANHVTGNNPSGPGYLTWLNSKGFSSNPADYPIVDIVDDGIGNGSVNSNDPTLHQLGSTSNPTRLAYVANCTSASNGAGPDGHGHINVSIAGGYDTRSGFPFRDPNGYQRGLGINPYGRFAGTRIFAPGFNLSNCGGTDTGLIKRSQDNGALILSNSWGCASCASQYDSSSQAYDRGVRDGDTSQSGNQQLTILFAAGNSGSGAGTIGSPGNGKNVITVGASENVRPSDESGSWSDGCGIGASGANSWNDVISFSSRGPAPGGRVKPEVIAPGTHIQGTASTNSSYNGSGVCDQYRPGSQTVFAASSGTSHSTPAVSGVASLYYYWLENNYSITPSPALMKAYMVAHPTYLTGVSANDTLPSNNQGYGMPNMETAFDNTARVIHNQTTVFGSSGQTWTWSGQVADPSKPVRIVLAYTDAPGAVGTSPQVNNLNLAATIGSSNYLGNRFSGQWSITGGNADNANNYEAIFLPAGTTGNINLTVTAFNIAGDGVPGNSDSTDQDFALVCYNCQTGGATPTPVPPTPTPTNTTQPPTATPPVPTNTPAPGGDIFFDSFETSQGWILNPNGTDTATAGIWERGVPQQTNSNGVKQLGTAVTGSNTLVTGRLAGVDAGTYDIDGGVTSVRSPNISLPSSGNITLSFSYYLAHGSNSSTADYLRVQVVGSTTQTVLQELGAANNDNAAWATYSGSLNSFAGQTIYLLISAADASTASLVEAAIDDVRIVATGGGPTPTPTNTPPAPSCVVYNSPNVPISLPNGTSSISSSLAVSGAPTVGDLNVTVNMAHAWVGDLRFVLRNQTTGTAVTIIDRPGVPASSYGCSGSNISAILSDEAGLPVENQCSSGTPTINGTFQPNGSLTAFDGQSGNGNWVLEVYDHYTSADSGTLNSWSIEICSP